MSIDAHRWLMTAPQAPLVRTAFQAAPQAGEVVVAIAGCGVCHTDLGYFYDGVRTNQPLPLALGHEISGRVVEAGAGAEGWLGKSVIVPAVLPCGECDLCQRGLTTICRAPEDARQRHPGRLRLAHRGAGARPVRSRSGAARRAPGLELAQVSIVADALTTPYQAVRRAGVTPGSLAIVVGAGGVGGYCVQVARAFGADGGRDRRRRRQAGRHRRARRGAHAQQPRARRQGDQGRGQRLRQEAGPAQHRMVHLRMLGQRAPASSRRTACWCTARRCRWSASPWTRSRCACPT